MKNNKNIVYILGAGASAQYSENSGNVPTVKNFLSKAYSCSTNKYDDMWEFIKCFWNLDEINSTNLQEINIEDLLSILDLARIRNEGLSAKYPIENVVSLYYKLLELIWETLTKTLRGEICKNHSKIIESFGHTKSETIISFNWDIVIDNALLRSRNSNGWCPDFGYGFKMSGVFIGEDFVSSEYKSGPSQRENSRPKLFKLHGSMHWLYCDECQSIYTLKSGTNNFFIKSVTKPEFRCPKDSKILQKVIIAFTWFKNYDIWFIRKMWREAYIKLSEAEEIVIIGYSLPDSDFHSRDLFLRAAYINANLEKVILVDKNYINLTEKYKNIFHKEKIYGYSSIEEFGLGEYKI